MKKVDLKITAVCTCKHSKSLKAASLSSCDSIGVMDAPGRLSTPNCKSNCRGNEFSSNLTKLSTPSLIPAGPASETQYYHRVNVHRRHIVGILVGRVDCGPAIVHGTHHLSSCPRLYLELGNSRTLDTRRVQQLRFLAKTPSRERRRGYPQRLSACA